MIRKFAAALLFMILTGVTLSAQISEQVKIYEDENGYRILVNDEPFEVKGVVWSFTPIGENYNYDLWSEPRDHIRRVIDEDAALMKQIGVNTVRVFDDVPAEWVEYLFVQHGIRSIINPLFGRYGMEVRGQWHPVTDYSDWYTRLAVQEEALEAVEKYKDVPGVLLFLFGNENNYGLEWDAGGTIEDLPVGQQMEVRAGYLYSLVEETISVAKTIDPDHPMGFVNGDLQYFNIIKELVPSLDIIGVNTYRGSKSYDLFFQSIQELGVPFVYTELGADAWNAASEVEDQYNQARYIYSQWEEIYQNAWGKSGYQNCVGAFVFEWIDEWWKHGMETGLDIHETEGTWTNGGYKFDAVPGKNNMNEEWFGILAQSRIKDNGINRKIPRAAFYMLGDIWQLSLYNSTDDQVANHFSDIDPSDYLGLSEGRSLRNMKNESPLTVDAFSVEGKIAGGFTDDQILQNGEFHPEAIDWQNSELVDVTLGVDLKDTVKGFVRVKLHGNSYEPVLTTPPDTVPAGAELYQAELTYEHNLFDLTGLFHSGHPDWAAAGDWFFLMPETYDFFGMDQSGSKAPYGIEVEGKNILEGLTIYAGPEIYWNARPQVMAKYDFGINEDSFSAGGTVIHSEEFGTGENELSNELRRKSSAYAYFQAAPYVRIDAGGLFSGMEKVGDSYVYARPAEGGEGLTYPADGSDSSTPNGSDWNLYQDGTIDYLDTLAGKVQLSTDIFRYTNLYVRYLYAGLVADSSGQVVRGGFMKGDNGSGNRQEIDLGSNVIVGPFSIRPELRWSAPIEGPMPAGLSLSRDPLNDPFYVFFNREVLEGELVFTYDPQGATWFHEWNWQDLENADFATSLSLLYTLKAGATDPTYFIDKESESYFNAFASGLPEQRNLWAVVNKFFWQAAPLVRISGEAKIGHEASFGQSARVVNYLGGSMQVVWDRMVLNGFLDWNAWGPEEWYRTFNITYPWQWGADLSFNFDTPSVVEPAGRVGIFFNGKSYGEYSDQQNDGLLMETGMYLNFSY